VQAYYRLLETERLTEVARASVAQLEAQQREAQSLFDNGVIGKNDLLRAGLALASARQREIQMRGSVVLARGQLATAMGEPPATEIEAEPFRGEPPALDEPSVTAAETRAATQRLEVRTLDHTIEQADRGVAVAKKKLLPQVSAVGNYTHFEGSQFQQENAAFVGLFASWDVWDWGTTTSGISSANAKLDQARIARKKLEDQVRLEARQAFVNAQSAGGAGRGAHGGVPGRGKLPHRDQEVRGGRCHVVRCGRRRGTADAGPRPGRDGPLRLALRGGRPRPGDWDAPSRGAIASTGAQAVPSSRAP
jgi:outer membrane protein TolC